LSSRLKKKKRCSPDRRMVGIQHITLSGLHMLLCTQPPRPPRWEGPLGTMRRSRQSPPPARRPLRQRILSCSRGIRNLYGRCHVLAHFEKGSKTNLSGRLKITPNPTSISLIGTKRKVTLNAKIGVLLQRHTVGKIPILLFQDIVSGGALLRTPIERVPDASCDGRDLSLVSFPKVQQRIMGLGSA
jgi:hypothetical protein